MVIADSVEHPKRASHATAPSREEHLIFVASDLTPQSDAAIREGHVRAQATSARLVVCHVVPNVRRVDMLFPQRQLDRLVTSSAVQRTARAALVDLTCALTGRADTEFEVIVGEGPPYARIVELAEDVGADLIIIGDHGPAERAHGLLGGVADRVIRHAHAPVLVARPGRLTGHLLVATDLSDPSRPALARAAREKRRTSCAVTALACVEPGDGSDVADVTRRLIEALHAHGLDAVARVHEGPAAASILEMAEAAQADLVVLGSRGTTALRRVLLGSVAETVIRHATTSVLVVPLGEREDAAGPRVTAG